MTLQDYTSTLPCGGENLRLPCWPDQVADPVEQTSPFARWSATSEVVVVVQHGQHTGQKEDTGDSDLPASELASQLSPSWLPSPAACPYWACCQKPQAAASLFVGGQSQEGARALRRAVVFFGSPIMKMETQPQITTRTLTLELDDPALPPVFLAQLTLLRDSLLINVGAGPPVAAPPFNIAQDFACGMPVSPVCRRQRRRPRV